MNRITMSLARLTTVGFVGLLAMACSHENQSTPPSTAQAPAAPQQLPSIAEQHGSPANEPGAMNPTEQSQAGQTPPAAGSSQPEQQGQQPETKGVQGEGGPQGMANGQPGREPTAPPQGPVTGMQPGTTDGRSPAPPEPGRNLDGRSPAPPEPGPNPDLSSLDDPQVAAVLEAINTDAIRQAQLAGNSASTPQVRQYARRVLVTHQSIQNQLSTLYQQTGVAPSPNAISNQIASDGQNEVTALENLRGRDFDRVYMDDQVRSLNNSLALLDRTMPNVQNPHLKAELRVARGEVDSHLKQAEKIQQQLQQGSTNRRGRGAPSRRGSMNVSPEGDGAMMR